MMALCRLTQQLVYVVVVLIVYAVNVVQPSTPTCPLTVATPTLTERIDLAPLVRVETVREVEIILPVHILRNGR